MSSSFTTGIDTANSPRQFAVASRLIRPPSAPQNLRTALPNATELPLTRSEVALMTEADWRLQAIRPWSKALLSRSVRFASRDIEEFAQPSFVDMVEFRVRHRIAAGPHFCTVGFGILADLLDALCGQLESTRARVVDIDSRDLLGLGGYHEGSPIAPDILVDIFSVWRNCEAYISQQVSAA